MSGKQTGLVWELDLPMPEKYILLALADHADQDGDNVFPSLGKIAWKTGYSLRQVQRMVKRFSARGILKTVDKDFGRWHTRNYSLTLEQVPRLPEYRGKRSVGKARGGVTYICHPGGDTIVSPRGVTPGCHPNGSITVDKRQKTAASAGEDTVKYVSLDHAFDDDKPNRKKKPIAPTTPLGKFMRENATFGAGRWEGFKDKAQRDAWLKMEHDFTYADIETAIRMAIKRGIKRANLANYVIAVVTNSKDKAKPQAQAEPLTPESAEAQLNAAKEASRKLWEDSK